MATKKLSTSLYSYFVMTVAMAVSFVLRHTSQTLRLLADLFASDTIDHLALRYANWYNLRLMSSLLNFEGRMGKKRISLFVCSQETLDNLMIANLKSQNLELGDIETYVSSRLSVMGGINHAGISLTEVGRGESKLLIPIVLN